MEQNKREYLDEHLPYMLKMVRYTYQQMEQPQHYLLWNAHFESFAVRARNLVKFLTNTDDQNFKAKDFATGYKANNMEIRGRMSKLRDQVFHLGKNRPCNVIDKFDVDDAKAVLGWIEKNFAEFLTAMGDQSSLFNKEKADPANDGAVVVSMTAASGSVQTACTAISSDTLTVGTLERDNS